MALNVHSAVPNPGRIASHQRDMRVRRVDDRTRLLRSPNEFPIINQFILYFVNFKGYWKMINGWLMLSSRRSNGW